MSLNPSDPYRRLHYRPTIAGVTSDVQPAGEKDEAILYRSEHAQYFNDKPQVQPEQHQRA